ncbi:MAG: SDR family oxidoreductase [Alphaproteobacteria bacterium]|nr:SDR family oxidoreductase [Alphaproteobacteria bacterium]
MKTTSDIKGKKVLLVGSTGILGKTHAKILADLGCDLVIADRPESNVSEFAKELDVQGLTMDVLSENSVSEGVASAVNSLGGLDGVVFNAAVTGESLVKFDNPFPDFDDYPLDLWNRVIDVNLTGAFLVARETGPALRKDGGGSLIMVSSIYGVVAPDHRIYEGQPFSSFPGYSASKAGIIGLSKWLATLWAMDDVRVNNVSPGGVYNNHSKEFDDAYSNRTPMGRMARPDDITGAIVYLLSDASKYFTGQNMVVDGGLSCW